MNNEIKYIDESNVSYRGVYYPLPLSIQSTTNPDKILVNFYPHQSFTDDWKDLIVIDKSGNKLNWTTEEELIDLVNKMTNVSDG